MKWGVLTKGKAVKRYKRFMVDCIVDNTLLTAHCANSGRMTGCIEENADVLLSLSSNKNRKYPYTLELVKMPTSWICVNTMRANQFAGEILNAKLIPQLNNYDYVKAEVTYPQSKSRVDFELTCNDGRR
ncbi:MAG: DNA/RNA nuclease SfsA, partial [Lentisphaeria bacterium]